PVHDLLIMPYEGTLWLLDVGREKCQVDGAFGSLFGGENTPLRTHVGHDGPRVAAVDDEVFTRVFVEGPLLDAG
ncbi:hypothetical protein QHH03_31025, partial [Aphanizomenon sp. 202]|nr:hypothetical protein [Aphanizomenon sp. 202]